MASLKKSHPLYSVYRHLMAYGQPEMADDVAEFGMMAQHNAEQLRLLQKYLLELEKQNPANSFQVHTQQVIEQREKIDRQRGNEWAIGLKVNTKLNTCPRLAGVYLKKRR